MLVLSFPKLRERSRSLERLEKENEKRKKNKGRKRQSKMTARMGKGVSMEDKARNRENRRKAIPEKGLVPCEWNTDQYQEPGRSCCVCSSNSFGLRRSHLALCF